MTESNVSTADLQAFLKSFEEKEQQLVRFKLNRDLGRYQQLFHGVSSIDRLGMELRKITAHSYNLFDILHVRHLEARVHTPFLANLLSPEGSHHQGDLFYNRFIENLFPDQKEIFKAGPFLRVIEEQSLRDLGRLDIVIRNYDPERPFAIIIENKIYAKDQLNQLQRYYDACTRYFGLETDQFKLCYLTLDKSSPTSVSVSVENYTDWSNKKLLRLVGYHDDIVPWLEECLTYVQAESVKSTIKQYITTIKTL